MGPTAFPDDQQFPDQEHISDFPDLPERQVAAPPPRRRAGRRRALLVAAVVTTLVAAGVAIVVVRGRHTVTDPLFADVAQGDLLRTYGITPGSRLTSEDSLRITESAVLENRDITGCVRIKADNVVIRNSRIRCTSDSTPVITVAPGLSGVVLDHVEIDGAGRAPICLGNGGFTLQHANVHGCGDGIRAGSNTLVENSWVHELARRKGSHNDAVQTVTGQNITIRSNRLQPFNSSTNDPMNAAYTFGPDQGPVSDITITGNYLDGGNYTLAGDADRVVIRDNVFTRRHRYGPLQVGGDATVSGNKYSDGKPVP